MTDKSFFSFIGNISWKQAFYLTLIGSVIITLAGLNIRELESGDETRVAGIMAETFLNGNYLLPCLNGKPFMEYPPLYYWCGAGSYALFGISDFAAKFPSAVAAIVASLTVVFLARKLAYKPWAGYLAGIMLISGAQFFSNSRKCMVDMLLATFILLAVTSFFAWTQSRSKSGKCGWFLLFSAALCGGIYTKGLIGAALPIGALGIWLVAVNIKNRRFTFGKYFTLGCGLLLALAGVGIWYYLIHQRYGEELFNTVFYVNNIGRFSGSQGDHVEPFYYYFIKLPSLFWPWLPLLVLAMILAARNFRAVRSDGELLIWCFLLVPFAMLLASAGKRIVYLLPLYAPAALVAAGMLNCLRIETWQIIGSWAQRLRYLLLGAVAMTALVLATIAALISPWFALWGILAALAALLTLTASKHQMLYLTISWCMLFAAIDGAIAWRDNQDSVRPLFEECQRLEEAGSVTILINPAERTSGAAYYYLKHGVTTIKEPSEQVPAGEHHILRSRQKPEKAHEYGDRHWLFLPEETTTP